MLNSHPVVAVKPLKNSQTQKDTWTRAQALRQCDLTSRQVQAWERQGLLTPKDEYSFEDLLELRVLARLKELGVSPAKLTAVFQSVHGKLAGSTNPLKELRVYVEGKRIRVQTEGKKMEALSGQLLLDFDQAELRRLLTFPSSKALPSKSLAEAEVWFQRALEIESSGADKREAIAAYEKALELNPNLSGALVNIGTIYFNARKWRESEKYYQQAILADNRYPLAHFNLANLHEELGRTSLAITHYKKALELQPSYADAHYNLALLFQTRGRAMEAIRHWKHYLSFDTASQWASIAKREMAKLKSSALVISRAASEDTESA
jgi:tetratricopeptide (TPR) repeat protein